jgi:hypothetical protein
LRPALDSGSPGSPGRVGCLSYSVPCYTEPNITLEVSTVRSLSGDLAPRDIRDTDTKELPIGLEVRPWSWNCSKYLNMVWVCAETSKNVPYRVSVPQLGADRGLVRRAGTSRGGRDLATASSPLVGKPY